VNVREEDFVSPTYHHTYGGTAQDVYVSREGFARFFEVSLHDVDNMAVNTKWFDVMEAKSECLGYKIQEKRGDPFKYRITIIKYRGS